jgi:hypothetical protein
MVDVLRIWKKVKCVKVARVCEGGREIFSAKNVELGSLDLINDK